MPRTVTCVKLGREAEGLERAPYPGELGQRIFDEISREAWQAWLAHQTMLINENRLEKLHAAIETGTDEGMQNFNQSLFQLVKDEIITKEEALEKATNAQALEMNFKGIFLSEGSRILN